MIPLHNPSESAEILKLTMPIEMMVKMMLILTICICELIFSVKAHNCGRGLRCKWMGTLALNEDSALSSILVNV